MPRPVYASKRSLHKRLWCAGPCVQKITQLGIHPTGRKGPEDTLHETARRSYETGGEGGSRGNPQALISVPTPLPLKLSSTTISHVKVQPTLPPVNAAF